MKHVCMAQRKILVMPDGNWLAHISRPLEIAKVLREMGHKVIFAGDGEYMKLPRKAGFPILPIKTIDPDRVLKCARRGRSNPYDYRLLKEFVEEDLRVFNEVRADLVLGDLRPSLSISCEKAGFPLATAINASWTKYYSVKIRSIEHSRIGRVVRAFLGRKLIARLELTERIKRLIIIIDSLPYRKLRREMGLVPCKNICEVIEGDLNLVCDIPEYAPTIDSSLDKETYVKS